jgi:hypothetical protein
MATPYQTSAGDDIIEISSTQWQSGYDVVAAHGAMARHIEVNGAGGGVVAIETQKSGAAGRTLTGRPDAWERAVLVSKILPATNVAGLILTF